MNTTSKLMIILGGLILIPAILLSNNLVSAQWFSTINSTSNSIPELSDTKKSFDTETDNSQPVSDKNQALPSFDTEIDTFPSQNFINNFPFIDSFPSLDNWQQIFPPNITIDNNQDIPDVPDYSQPPSNLTGWFEQWQKIANQPIGVAIDTQKKARIFQERKQVFDSWFEQEWQRREIQETQCQQWWCITTPNWAKDLSYTLWKFDFSIDWAWNQFKKDHLDN